MKHNLLRAAAALLAALTLAGTLSGCSAEEKTDASPLSATDTERVAPEDARIGVMEGSTNEIYAEEHYPDADRQSFKNYVDSSAALSSGKLDYAMMDYTNALRFTRNNPDLEVASEFLTDEKLCIGVSKSNPELYAQVNEVMDQFLQDGTVDAAVSRWIKPDGSDYDVVETPKLPDAPKIKVAIVSSREPTSFVMDGKYAGLDVDLIDRILYELGYQAEYLDMEWGAVIAAVGSNKVDLTLGMYNTPERAERLLFTAPYFTNPQVLVARKLEQSQFSYTELSQLDGKALGIITGSVLDQKLSELLPNATFSYYDNTDDTLAALKNGKVEGMGIDAPMARLYEDMNPDLTILPGEVMPAGNGMAFAKGSPLVAEFNREIASMQKSGLLDELADKWMGADSSVKTLFEPKNTGENGTLQVACTATMEPMCYLGENGSPIGYEVDLVLRIADILGKKVEFVQVEFSELVPMLESGEADLAIGCLTITDERKQIVDLSEPYYSGGILMLVRKPVEASEGEYTTLDQLIGKQLSCMSGSVFDQLILEKIPDVKFSYYNNAADELSALRNHKVEAFPMDEPVAQLILAKNDDMAIISEPLEDDSYGMVLVKGSPLTAEINAIISQLKSDGTLDEIFEKWLYADKDTKLPDLNYDAPNGTLRLACCVGMEPMCYSGSDGTILGYETEVAVRVAQALGRKVQFTSVDFAGLIPMVQSGKADVALGCVSITDDRKLTVDITDSHRDGGIVIVVRKKAPATAESTDFLADLKQSFISTFVTESRWKLIVKGLEVTALISIASGVLGSALGFVICMARRSKNRLLSGLMSVFIRIVQGTPIVVFLMILYYIIFQPFKDMPAELAAIIGFSINFGVYVSEMLRTGIDAVDKGQIEAAHALGFTKIRTFWKITFPQAARHFLPIFKGEFISMVKMTSVVGYIAIQDLTKVSDIIRSRTLEAFFPLIATAVLYFILANLLTMLLTRLEITLDPKRRKRTVKGVVTQ